MNHRDTENIGEAGIELAGRVIGAAIEVHQALGPGLPESAYQACLARESSLQHIAFEQQKALPVCYKGLQPDYGYRLDFVVADELVVELEAIETLRPIHQAQMLTYLKLTGYRVG